MTHRFHPLFGRQLEFVKRRKNWDQDRSMSATRVGRWSRFLWSGDVVAEDPFVVVAAGRAPFHVAGLLELAELVARLSAGDAPPVMGIMP